MHTESGTPAWRRRAAAAVVVLLATVLPVLPRAAPRAAAAVPPAVGPFTTVRQFVTQQFEDYVGRGPGNRDLGTFVTGLRSGELTTPAAFDRIAARRSTAELSASVVRLYKAYLNRLPDAGGWRYWLGLRRSGIGVLDIAANFGASSEFTGRYGGLDDEGFVRLAYRNVLRRAPDQGGLDFWMGQLASGHTRSWVMVGLCESSEHQARTAKTSTVFLAFAAMLHRPPTTTELSDIAAEDPVPSFAELAMRILEGDEYAALHPPTSAVAYQGNALHDGRQAAQLAAAPRERWRHAFDNTVSYPLIADGRAFVVVKGREAGIQNGSRLYALDDETGGVIWGPISLGSAYSRSGLAYEAGRVFVVNHDGLLRALDAATGDQLWSRSLPGQYSFTSAPTASGGVVFVGGAGSGGTLYAVDSTTGAVVWTRGVANGDESSPAVDGDGVFVSYACLKAYRFHRAAGALIWTNQTSCEGGGGRTPVVHDGKVYVRDTESAIILSEATGQLLRNSPSGPAPAFHGTLGFFLNAGTLEGVDAASGDVLWSQAADGGLVSAPVSVDDRVYVGSESGQVFAFDEHTGRQVWAAAAGRPVLPAIEYTASQPLIGFGAGDGLLVVPATDALVAYG
jgi:outer membrane protein assembly factor BamB